MATFTPGQKVRNAYGEILTVYYQDECRVFVLEQTVGHYPPSKLWTV